MFAFATDRAFDQYKKRFNGKPVSASGYFVRTSDYNLVGLSDQRRDDALRIVFHEYAHLVISARTTRLPTWLNEGLADYYCTFALRNDGKGGVLGGVIPYYLG